MASYLSRFQKSSLFSFNLFYCQNIFRGNINHFLLFLSSVKKFYLKVPQNIIFPALTITIIYWLAGVHPDASAYFIILALLVIASNTAVGFGTFLAVITPNLDATIGLIGPAFFPMLIFSGFLINSKSIPVYFIWIKYLSWVYYTNEAVMITLWSRVKEIECNDKVNFCIKNGNEVLKQLAMDEVF